MTWNDRRRSVLPINFWSFNFIDVKVLPLQFGRKTFTGFKIADLESWTLPKILFLLHKRSKKLQLQLSIPAITKPVNCLLPNWSGKPLTSMKLNDQKLEDLLTSLYHFHSLQKGHFTMWLFNGVQILLSISVLPTSFLRRHRKFDPFKSPLIGSSCFLCS